MSDTHRRVEVDRTGPLRFRATNNRGATVEMGLGESADFTPVELLLAAIAGCNAIDVESITGKRSDPTTFSLTVEADKVRDERGNHLADVALDFVVEFPDTEDGRAAEAVLQRAITLSHDRLCTVSRTVQLPTTIRPLLRGAELRS